VSSQADGAGCQYNKQSKHKKKLKQTRSSSSAGVFVKQPCKDVYIYIPAVCLFFPSLPVNLCCDWRKEWRLDDSTTFLLQYTDKENK
jgi:hypothetical protein